MGIQKKKLTKREELEAIFSGLVEHRRKARGESYYDKNSELSYIMRDFELQCKYELAFAVFSKKHKAKVIDAAEAYEALINCFLGEDNAPEQREEAIKDFQEKVGLVNFKTKKWKTIASVLRPAAMFSLFFLVFGIVSFGMVLPLVICAVIFEIEISLAAMLWTAGTLGLVPMVAMLDFVPDFSPIKKTKGNNAAEQLVPACEKFEEDAVKQQEKKSQFELKQLEDTAEVLKRKEAMAKQARGAQLVRKAKFSVKQNLEERKAAALINSVFRKHQGSMQPNEQSQVPGNRSHANSAPL